MERNSKKKYLMIYDMTPSYYSDRTSGQELCTNIISVSARIPLFNSCYVHSIIYIWTSPAVYSIQPYTCAVISYYTIEEMNAHLINLVLFLLANRVNREVPDHVERMVKMANR